MKKSSNDKRGIILKRKWSSSDGLIEVKWDADTNSRLGMVYIHKTLLVYYRDL